MSKQRLYLATIFLAAAALTVGAVRSGWFSSSGDRERSSSAVAPGEMGRTHSGETISKRQFPAHATGIPAWDQANPCVQTAALLSGQTSDRVKSDAVQRLLQSFSQMPREGAVRAVLDFLRSGRDAETGMGFKLAEGRKLAESPTLRVALMDWLGQTASAAAVDEARRTLSAPTTPDEWAVSMRNLAWHSTDELDKDFLRTKALELVRYGSWRQAPSAGYFEAFDVVVYTRAVDAVPDLSTMAAMPGRGDLNYASFLAMDRLVSAVPSEALGRLIDQPDLMAKRPEMVANMFARADVRDENQKAVLERYLVDPRRTAIELEAFANVYPNANAMVSTNLLTTSQTNATAVGRDHDEAALKWVERCLTNPAYSSMRPLMEKLKTRLHGFVSRN